MGGLSWWTRVENGTINAISFYSRGKQEREPLVTLSVGGCVHSWVGLFHLFNDASTNKFIFRLYVCRRQAARSPALLVLMGGGDGRKKKWMWQWNTGKVLSFSSPMLSGNSLILHFDSFIKLLTQDDYTIFFYTFFPPDYCLTSHWKTMY